MTTMKMMIGGADTGKAEKAKAERSSLPFSIKLQNFFWSEEKKKIKCCCAKVGTCSK